MNIEKVIKVILKDNGGIPFNSNFGTSKGGFIEAVITAYKNKGQSHNKLLDLQLFMENNLPLGNYVTSRFKGKFNNKNENYHQIYISYYIKTDWHQFEYTYHVEDKGDGYFNINKKIYPNFKKL